MYEWGGAKAARAEAVAAEVHNRAKFEYFRNAEAKIDAAVGPDDWSHAPFRKRAATAQCGTHSGYKTHITNHTTPCRDCKTARAIYQRDYRARKAA